MIAMSSGFCDILDTDLISEEEKEFIRKRRAEEEERLSKLALVYIGDDEFYLDIDEVKDLYEQLKEILDNAKL